MRLQHAFVEDFVAYKNVIGILPTADVDEPKRRGRLAHSARLYWESKLAFFAPKGVAIPVAVSAFPDELYQAPRSWTERAYPKLIHYNKLDKGGHFAAWEQPQLFSEEVRAGFRSLR